MLTQHAENRIQQRGIPPMIVDLLLDYGDIVHDKHGAEILYFGKRAQKKLKHYAGQEFVNKLAKYLRAYAVVRSGQVVTCGHRLKKIKRH